MAEPHPPKTDQADPDQRDLDQTDLNQTDLEETDLEQTELEQTDPDSQTEAPEPTPTVDVHAMRGGLRAAVEAVLMVADEPLSDVVLAQLCEVPVPEIRETLLSLAEEYDGQDRGFELRAVAGGWRVFSRADLADLVGRFVLDGQTARLSQAALETLAVIAYRQPVSRARIAAIRGVSVDGVVRTLTVRGLISEVSHDESSGAILYGTTPAFLERMGLISLEDLPALAPYLPDNEMLEELVKGTS